MIQTILLFILFTTNSFAQANDEVKTFFIERFKVDGVATVRVEIRLCIKRPIENQSLVKIYDDTNGPSQFYTAVTLNNHCASINKDLTTWDSQQVFRYEFDDTSLNQVHRFYVDLNDLDFKFQEEPFYKPSHSSWIWGQVPISALPRHHIQLHLAKTEGGFSHIRTLILWHVNSDSDFTDKISSIRLLLNSELISIPVVAQSLTACNAVYVFGVIDNIQPQKIKKNLHFRVETLNHKSSICMPTRQFQHEVRITAYEKGPDGEFQPAGLIRAAR